MKERERIVVSGLLTLMFVTWLGFFFHRSPRFAGSLAGFVFAVGGSALMLVPLLYLVIKRIPPLKRWFTERVSMRTLLSWHIYAGVLGPILVLIHTGHKFDSALGVALTAMTLIVVVSGFVGRYLMSFLGREIKSLRETLAGLRTEYEEFARSMRATESPPSILGLLRVRISSLAFSSSAQVPPDVRAAELASAIADTEFAIASNERFKRAFSLWLKVHIVLSLVLYALLAFHVWVGLYFGLRWVP